MINPYSLSVPVRLSLRGKAGVLVVWLRQLSASAELRLKRSMRQLAAVADDEAREEAWVSLMCATVAGAVDRVEVDSEDYAPLPDGLEARRAWVDALGSSAMGRLFDVVFPEAEEGDAERVGKLGSGRTSPAPPETSATSATS